MTALYKMSKHIISGHLNLSPEDFLPASKEEKEGLVVMRQSVSFWQDGFRRLLKNKVALASLAVFFVILILAFIVPIFYPYDYATQLQGSERLMPMQYSASELARIASGESIFPHILGTDSLGRDYAIRVMMGARISLIVGLLASFIVLIIGSIYGSVAAFTGGWVDLIMMRIVDIIYTVPDILLIILLTFALKKPMKLLASAPGFGWINILGINLISIFIVFALLYWVGMARIVRGQILVLKEQEYVTAASTWSKEWSDYQKALTYKYYWYIDSYNYIADTFRYFYRELFVILRTWCGCSNAITRFTCFRCYHRIAIISTSFICTGNTYQFDNT